MMCSSWINGLVCGQVGRYVGWYRWASTYRWVVCSFGRLSCKLLYYDLLTSEELNTFERVIPIMGMCKNKRDMRQKGEGRLLAQSVLLLPLNKNIFKDFQYDSNVLYYTLQIFLFLKMYLPYYAKEFCGALKTKMKVKNSVRLMPKIQ